MSLCKVYSFSIVLFCLLGPVVPAVQAESPSWYFAGGTWLDDAEVWQRIYPRDFTLGLDGFELLDDAKIEGSTEFSLRAGVVVPLESHFRLQAGLSLGEGTVEFRRQGRLGELPLAISGRTDVEWLGAELRGRYDPFPDWRLQPWLSLGVQVLLLQPGTPELLLSEEVVEGSPDFRLQDEWIFDPVAGLGIDVPISDGVAVTTSGQYGLDTGWQLSAGFLWTPGELSSGVSSGSCRRECRDVRKQCKQDCRHTRNACMDECSGLRGRDRRRCRRQCRRDFRACKRECRRRAPECREECAQPPGCAPECRPDPECSNGGLEQGTLQGWSPSAGTYTSSSDGGEAQLQPSALIPGRHTLMTPGSGCGGFDCQVGGSLLPVVPPGGGGFSIRLGNESTGAQAESLAYVVQVTPATETLRFRVAVVLEDPGHDGRPFFQYRIRRAAPPWDVLQEFRIEAKNDPYFDGAVGNVLYRGWSCQALDLSAYAGQAVVVEFTTADCSHGGHFGYAYLDLLCADEAAVGAVAAVEVPERVCLSGPIRADGSASEREADHFWSIEESDANWGRNPQTEVTQWFLAQEAGPIDLAAFYASKGGSFKCNTYYRVKVAVSSACTGWDEDVKLMYVACPQVDAGPDVYVCPDSPRPITVGTSDAGKGLTYAWTPEDLFDDPTRAQPSLPNVRSCSRPGTQSSPVQVTATDAEGCQAQDETEVIRLCPPTLNIQVSEAECCGTGRTLTAELDHAHSGSTYTYRWSPGGQTTPSITVDPQQTTTYSVTVSDPCFDTTASVDIEPAPPRLQGGFPELIYPNAFTPNRRPNDLFVVFHKGLANGAVPAYNATHWRFFVFDRWGGEIVSLEGGSEASCGLANGSLPRWDGRANRTVRYKWWQFRRNTFAGDLLPQGVYNYILELRNCSGGGTFGPWRRVLLERVTVVR